MYAITVPRPDQRTEEVAWVLRDRLGPGYDLLPGMRQTRPPFSEPVPGTPDTIVVGIGSNRVQRAQVTVIRGAGGSEIDVSPGGLVSDLVRNTLVIARKIQHVLATAPGFNARRGRPESMTHAVIARPVGSESRRPRGAGDRVPIFLHTLANATQSLAVTEALPTLWVLAYAIWRRRIEPVGAIAVTGFGIAVTGFGIAPLVTIALGGSSLPLELHRALFPGAVGLACLVSLAARRPLLSIAGAKLHARADAATESPPEPATPASIAHWRP